MSVPCSMSLEGAVGELARLVESRDQNYLSVSGAKLVLEAAKAHLAELEAKRPKRLSLDALATEAGFHGNELRKSSNALADAYAQIRDILRALDEKVVPWLRQKGTMNFEADCAAMLCALGESP